MISYLSGLEERHFSYLLLVLVLLNFVAPVVSGPLDKLVPWLNNAVYTVGILFALLAAAFITSGNRRTLRFVLVAVVAAVVAGILHALTGQEAFFVVRNILMIAVVAVVIASIVVYLFEATVVTKYTIYGSLCAYLLMALLWAALYGVVEIFETGSFHLPGGASSTEGLVQSFDGLYFSLVTLTTLGYGDITPVSGPAKMLATGEAVTGQIYLVVTVARLVSIYSSKVPSDNQS